MANLNVRITLTLAMTIIATGVFQSCKKSDTTATSTGDWVQRSSFEGYARSSAVSFTINDIGYVGTGFDNTNRLRDFWAYDPHYDNWYKQDSLPAIGGPRSEGVGFAVSGKGYVGTGTDGTNYFNDFWEFTPDPGGPSNGQLGSWTQISNFPGNKRSGAVAFGLGSYGYVGSGYSGNAEKDFYRYDPSSNTWYNEKGTYSKKTGAFAFVIGSKAYVGGGINNSTYLTEFQEFTPYALTNITPTDSGGTWKKMDYLDDGHDIRRMNAATCVINGRGIVSTGYYNTAISTSWEYTPDPNPTGLGSWDQKVDFEGAVRTGAVGLTIGNKGFILTGKNGNSRYDDMWELHP
ncbi:MAG: hypothetical protein JWO58_1732 [Chitinophagaceae bacterium]|nr:hypothetical protein [Chitinophagaceae bacterium]